MFRPQYQSFVMHLPEEGQKSGQNRKEEYYHHHHHHHQAIMEVGHWMIRSGLTYPEVSSEVSPGSFCLWVYSFFLLFSAICYEAFCLHVVGIRYRNTVASPAQERSSPSLGIPCSHKWGNDNQVTAVLTVSSGMGEMPSQNMHVQRLKVSKPTTVITLLWARNPFWGNFNCWQVSKEAGRCNMKLTI